MEQSLHKIFLTKQWTTPSKGYKVSSTSEMISWSLVETTQNMTEPLKTSSNDSEDVVSPSTQRDASFVCLRLNSSVLCSKKMYQSCAFLLGMAQYSARFISNFAEMTTPLRKLTHQGVKWCWSSTEQAAFDKLNETPSSDNVLEYYEAGLETRLLVDAGPNGLGLVLLQRKPEGWKAVECASRRLTEVAKWYPLIDREALAIRWARERCYLYLTGSSFVFETDHP